MASSSSGAAPVSVAPTGPTVSVAPTGSTVRVLTASETTLVNRVAASQGISKNDLLPNDTFITITPYGSRWYNDFFKAFIQLNGDMNENLAMIRRFESLLAADPSIPNSLEKERSVRNRKRELLINAYYQQNPTAKQIEKVVCCIIRGAKKGDPPSDGFAIYVNNSSIGKLGFPKGDIEYFVTDPTDIHTVQRETPLMGAFRELLEETGFEPKGTIDFSIYPHSFTLEYSGDVLNIVNSKAVVEGNVFYLVLFTDTNAPLKPDVPPTARLENIDYKKWNKQSTSLTKHDFNVISQKTFQYSAVKPHRPDNEAVLYLGGRRTRKRTDKRKQKKRKSKTRVVHRKH
jgi:8-oxo-dGTP pyrophosphatase MutT (NUDIX family)